MTATAESTETKGAPTSLADVAITSELKDLGWSVNGEPGSWTAFEKAGDLRKVGPAKTIKALHTQVKLAAGVPEPKANGKTVKAGSSKLADGKFVESKQPILTGTEDAVFADLTALGVDYRRTTMEILRLQKLQSSQRDSLKEMMGKFKDELNQSEDANGNLERFFVVEVDGQSVDILLATEEREVVKTRKHSA